MSKLNNFRVNVVVEGGKNPSKKGSFKWVLMDWALSQPDGFTKNEFLEASQMLREEYEVESKMSPETQAKAWWNEFLNKYRYFRIAE